MAKTARAARAGFTLLEVIVATALMGLAVVGLMGLVNQSMFNAVRIRQYDRAAMLARTQMNALQTLDPLPLNRPLSGKFDGESGWEAKATPYDSLGEPAVGRSMLARIELTIWWRDGGRRHSIGLEGFRRMRITPGMDLGGFSGGGQLDPGRLF